MLSYTLARQTASVGRVLAVISIDDSYLISSISLAICMKRCKPVAIYWNRVIDECENNGRLRDILLPFMSTTRSAQSRARYSQFLIMSSKTASRPIPVKVRLVVL